MHIGRPKTSASQARVIVVTADAVFEDAIRATFGTSPQIGLDIVTERLSGCSDAIDLDGATVLVADVEAGDEAELAALDRLVTRIGNGPPLVAFTQAFDANIA